MNEHKLSKAVRMAFRDAAFPFRMGAGFAGDVNRTHPFSEEPNIVDTNAPPLIYGQALILDPTTLGMRPFAAGDTGVTIPYGALVRPFPITGGSANPLTSQPIGSATPPTAGAIDVLRSGYMIVNVNGVCAKGGQVHVWCAASSGNHVQGGYEAAASGGNTADLDINRYTFNGAPDSSGNVEIYIR
jgi:hypothetical protein